MRTRLYTICGITACAIFGAGCATKAGYSPPPERRAGDRCPAGETWVCRDRYPTRLPRENQEPMICYCDNMTMTR